MLLVLRLHAIDLPTVSVASDKVTHRRQHPPARRFRSSPDLFRLCAGLLGDPDNDGGTSSVRDRDKGLHHHLHLAGGRDLVAFHGQAYVEYRRRVSMLISAAAETDLSL
jgi:hypothetical protein